MNKATKVALLLAAVLVVLGITLVLWAMSGLGWNFLALSTTKYETDTYLLDQPFNRIAINTDTTDIRICLAEDGLGRLEISQLEKLSHRVSVENGVLTVTQEDARNWHDHITLFTIGEGVMTLYLPQEDYEALEIALSTGDVTLSEEIFIGDVSICATTGDVRLEKLTTEGVDVETDTGDITLTSVTCVGDVKIEVNTGETLLRGLWCENLISNGTTGDITVEDGTAKTVDINRDTGYVCFQNADAGEITVETSTGDVYGSVRTDKIFYVQTSTGDVNVPQSVTGGLCEITTSTGDIRITVN